MLIKFISIYPLGKIERTEFTVKSAAWLEEILKDRARSTIRTLALIK